MAANGNMKGQDQEHPSPSAKIEAKDQAAQQKNESGKAEVLDQFEIQRRLFFGK